MINSRKILFSVYQLKILELTVMAWKIFLKIRMKNYGVSLLPKTKTNYYANLNLKHLTNNKQIWQTVKPLLSDKIKSSEKITLVEQREYS